MPSIAQLSQFFTFMVSWTDWNLEWMEITSFGIQLFRIIQKNPYIFHAHGSFDLERLEAIRPLGIIFVCQPVNIYLLLLLKFENT